MKKQTSELSHSYISQIKELETRNIQLEASLSKFSRVETTDRYMRETQIDSTRNMPAGSLSPNIGGFQSATSQGSR